MHHTHHSLSPSVPTTHTCPVFMMDEIVTMCKESPEASISVSDLLNKRLGNRSPVVKFKVCGESHVF